MSITSSSMKCPVCPDQTLETLSAALGSFERCPNCDGLFIHQDLIAAASPDRAKCMEALAETKTLLLPTEWWCPKCLQKLFDGRARSRGVIFTLCPSCESFWTSLAVLRQFEESVEKTLRIQIEIAASTGVSEPSSSNGSWGAGSSIPLYDDSGVGSFLRSFARLFDRLADRLNQTPDASPKKAVKAAKPQPKKPLILEAQPEMKTPEVSSAPPAMEIPEFIFPEESTAAGNDEKKDEPVTPPEPVKPAELIKVAEAVQAVTPKPLPVPRPVPIPKPVSPKPASTTPGFFAKFKAAWSPAPKKAEPSVKLPPPVKKIEPVKYIPKAIDVPQPKPATTPKGPSIFGKLLGALKPPPRKPVVKPTLPTTPVTPPVVAIPESAKKPVPVVAAKKPTPAPKPKREKTPRDPSDPLVVWPPWAVAVLGVVFSAFRDFGFEAGPAVLWGLAGWSLGSMVRFFRLYRSPVTVKGQIVLADELKPKGEVVFKAEDKTILLNRLGRWDMIPRLFGLDNPRQLPKGEVTMIGWYRGTLIPSFEIHEVPAEKTIRKSMVRSLRWASAIIILVMAIIIYASLE